MLQTEYDYFGQFAGEMTRDQEYNIILENAPMAVRAIHHLTGIQVTSVQGNTIEERRSNAILKLRNFLNSDIPLSDITIEVYVAY